VAALMRLFLQDSGNFRQMRGTRECCGRFVTVWHDAPPILGDRGKNNGNDRPLSGASCASLADIAGGKAGQKFGCNAIRACELCSQYSGPPFGGDAVSLPPLRNGRCTGAYLGGHCFARRPKLDD
jgi:hypothetical protein